MLHICALSYNFLVSHKFKNLIFDLGGVIINLDVTKTYQAFATLGQCTIEEVKAKISGQSFFDEYEKGALTDDQFRLNLRALLSTNVNDSQIDSAWNAILLDIQKEKYQML